MILEEYQKLLEKLKMLGDRAFVMSHIRVGLRKKAVDQVLRQSTRFDGIEAYLFVRFELEGDTWNYVKLNDGALEIIDVTEEEAWKQAYANVCSEVRIRPLFEHLQELALERGMDNRRGRSGRCQRPVYRYERAGMVWRVFSPGR